MRSLRCAATVLLAGAAALSTTSLPAQAATGSADGPHAAAPSSGSTPATYLVVLRRAPAASYDGEIPGLAATSPAAGQRFDGARPAVTAYRSFLLRDQAELLAAVDGPRPLYSYTTALNGFAARLTPAQADRLADSPAVLRVQPDALLSIDGSAPSSTPAVTSGACCTGVTRGATAPVPPSRVAVTSVNRGAGGGRGAVIGVIDTGVWPENPSLAGIPLLAQESLHRYPAFTGTCSRGERWSATTCNTKVIGAQYFVRGFGADNVAQSDFLSARDASGHGTSVAAVAAGNPGVDARIQGQHFGPISGAAPDAAISVYKACWTAPDPSGDGCDTADAVAAIDKAVADGVDVLNYSIGGTTTDTGDAVELAFRNAAAAHVFVVTSAGNAGPAAGSVEHPSPWVTTVGASTATVYQGGLRLGNGRLLIGAMLSDKSVTSTRLVSAADAPAAGISARRAALCYSGSLDARRVDGGIVICDRGATSRVSKSAAVERAGGAAMVLVNTAPGSVDADLQRVPTVHLDAAAGREAKAYVARLGAAATGQLVASATNHPAVPGIASFSSRGPTSAWSGDLVKPDLTAPGVSVVSATSPAGPSRLLWDVRSGTSIAAPYVAGVAAVLRAVHPSWTPSMAKSAMMTTATPLAGSAGPLVRGAGQLEPSGALAPGLVYANDRRAWAALAAGRLDARNVNLPSIALGDLVGTTMIRRTVTNVGSTTKSYTAAVRGLPGIVASIAPHTITVAPGQSASYTVTFMAGRQATYDAFSTGSLTWRDSAGHRVTSSITVRPELASVPAEITASGRSGTAVVRGVAGVTGTIHATTSGLVGAVPRHVRLLPSAFDPEHPGTSDAVVRQTLRVPPDSRATRLQLSAAPGADVRLYVYRDGNLIGSATTQRSLATRLTATTQRSPASRSVATTQGDGVVTMTLTRPPLGTYSVYVRAASTTTTTDAVRATLTTWVLPGTEQPNLVVTPPAAGVTGGERFAVNASWSSLDPGHRWWGYVAYRGLPDVTYLTVN